MKSLNDISQWNICNFKNLMYFLHMPYCSTLLTLKLEYDIAKFDFSTINIVKSNNIDGIFYGCKSLKFLTDLSKRNISKIEDMNYIFSGCKS